jgi:Ca2+:H+ antiporter
VDWRDWLDPRRVGWMRMLLVFVPVAIGLDLVHATAAWRFLAAALAIIPLAGVMGEATEDLAHRFGSGIGGLLNATFGNAAELILALFALRYGIDDVVKASLTGSILGNLLLVLGGSLLAGGLRFSVQRFNRTVVSAGSTLMALAAIGMLVPALFHHLVGRGAYGARLEHRLSVSVCVVLLTAYGLSLVFSLKTHRDLFTGRRETQTEPTKVAAHPSARRSAGRLVLATLGVAWASEILTRSVTPTAQALGWSEVFIGVIVIAIIGNAAEHSTAVLAALKNEMDLAVGIAIGSALQIALFVAPVLVLASYLRREPMDLLFTTMEIVAVILAVVLARMIIEDGESNWLEGAMLLLIYAIIALAFFFLPAAHEPKAGVPDDVPAAASMRCAPVPHPPAPMAHPPFLCRDRKVELRRELC